MTEAPKCNIEVADESGMEFSCKYYGSERVNFSRGKQIADLALNKLKTANNHAPCNILIKEKEFLICNENQDFAMVPYDKITYQGMLLYFQSIVSLVGGWYHMKGFQLKFRREKQHSQNSRNVTLSRQDFNRNLTE